MKTGQQVGYITTDGKRHAATITAVAGKGASNFKTLSLSYRQDGEEVLVAAVPHENDVEPGGAFWLEQGVRRQPEEAAPEAAEPAQDAEPKRGKK